MLASLTSNFEFPIFAFGFIWRFDRKFGFRAQLRRLLGRDLPANELDTCHDRGTVAYVVTQRFCCSIVQLVGRKQSRVCQRENVLAILGRIPRDFRHCQIYRRQNVEMNPSLLVAYSSPFDRIAVMILV
jgi:hypothetical protein